MTDVASQAPRPRSRARPSACTAACPTAGSTASRATTRSSAIPTRRARPRPATPPASRSTSRRRPTRTSMRLDAAQHALVRRQAREPPDARRDLEPGRRAGPRRVGGRALRRGDQPLPRDRARHDDLPARLAHVGGQRPATAAPPSLDTPGVAVGDDLPAPRRERRPVRRGRRRRLRAVGPGRGPRRVRPRSASPTALEIEGGVVARYIGSAAAGYGIAPVGHGPLHDRAAPRSTCAASTACSDPRRARPP